jgi:hypothetical protein
VIHYHGTPIGGKIEEAARFLQGRHALINYLHKQHQKEVLAYCQSFILDSGTFGAWRKGFTIDFEAYTDWVRSLHRHPGYDWALISDVIDGTEAENDRLLDKWPEDLHGVPVWHLHESIERFNALAKNFRTVALGSSGEYKRPNSRKWWDRIRWLFDQICDENGQPPCKLHGLRMLNPEVFTVLPLSSGDSTQVAINGGKMSAPHFGRYLPPSTFVRSVVLADRIESYNSAAVWEKNCECVQAEVPCALSSQPEADYIQAEDQV